MNDAVNNDFLENIEEKSKELYEKIISSKSEYNNSGRCYYISPDGNDEFDGCSPEKAWKTLSRASSQELEKGDVLLLERGKTFRDSLYIKYNGITVSAYGKGEKPKIFGSFKNYADSSFWDKTEYENLYVCTEKFETDVGLVVFDGGKANSFKQLKKNFGFTGALSEVNKDLQIYYDEETKKLYLYCEGKNPGERFFDIEICSHVSLVYVKSNDTVIDNLCLKYCGGHAIRGSNSDGLTVKNCEIGWVGGCKQFELKDGRSVRYGNGVEVYVNCKNFTVKDSYFYEIYDAAITHQFFADNSKDIVMENIVYSGNLIERCNYSIEYALIKQSGATEIMRNVRIKDNIMRFSGYGFSNQRPDKDGASHIKGWDICNRAEDFIIENNIFDRGKYMVIHASAQDEKSLPVFLNNIYIQTDGGQWGRYGVAPTELKYTADSESFFIFDKQAKWYITE